MIREIEKATPVDTVYILGRTVMLCPFQVPKCFGLVQIFVPVQKYIYILWHTQTFCARQKDDLQSVKLVFVLAQKFLKRY